MTVAGHHHSLLLQYSSPLPLIAAAILLATLPLPPLLATFPHLGHPPPLLDGALEVAPNVQCFGRCVAKCMATEIALSQCQTNCRQYGMQNLCATDDQRKKRGNSDSNSREHRHPFFASQKWSKNTECWKRCKDLGSAGTEGGHTPTPPPPKDVQASINENFTIDIAWQPGPGPEAEKASLYLIEIQSESPNHQTSQILAEGLKYSGLTPSSPENLCGPITIRVAAIIADKGVGHFSKAAMLEGRAPNIPARMELHWAKFNSTPFVKDEYESNGTLDVELKFQFNGWPFGIEDLEVNPIFHMLGCEEPDLSQAIPFSDFSQGTKPNTVVTHIGADMMYRRCRFTYAVEEARSIKCERQYGIVAGENDFQPIEFTCKTVEDSQLARENCPQKEKKSEAPYCGYYFDKFNYTIDEEEIDANTKEETLSINITFEPTAALQRKNPKYYVAIYGNAVKAKIDEGLFSASASSADITTVLGEQTSCAEFSSDGCKRFNANSKNLITLDGLKRNTNYGVVLCAVLDPANLAIPPVNTTDKFAKPYAYAMFLPPKAGLHHPHHKGGEESEEEGEEGSRRKMEHNKRFMPYMVAGIASLLALMIVAVLAIFCWIRAQKDQLRKKRLNLEAMRRDREHRRYTDFPAREDPWELERRNLIIYEDKKLGSGAFGSVYLGKLVGINRLKNGATNLSTALLRAENALVAVKMLPEYADDLSKSEFLREIGLMKSLGYHERLVNMLACVTQSEPYCLLVEYCSDGDLLQFLRHRCKYMLELDDGGINYSDPLCEADFDVAMIMTIKQLLMFAVQISYGLEYLSQKGFVHRDVAARNILVHDKTHAKIGDFGLCRFIYADSANYKGRGGRLPIKWMSPEAIRHYEFTTSSDVWSFGVLMFEIITLGGTPYPGIQPDDMLSFLESANRMAQPDNCSNEFYKVMCACWASDPRMRPDFAAIRQQLALQLENVSDEYAYLKLDAKKDYYNVSYGELRAQRGEEGEAEGMDQNEEEEEEMEEKGDAEEMAGKRGEDEDAERDEEGRRRGGGGRKEGIDHTEGMNGTEDIAEKERGEDEEGRGGWKEEMGQKNAEEMARKKMEDGGRRGGGRRVEERDGRGGDEGGRGAEEETGTPRIVA